jgi:SAM-dependent methyltransferase
MTLIQRVPFEEKETSAAPYDPMAPHYEAFVGDAEVMRYGEWLAGLLAHAPRHGVTGGPALDVGCGTGRSVATLLATGFEAEGVDPSRGMMEIARRRLGADVPLHVGALPELPEGSPMAFITAFNDVINCVAPSDLDRAVASLAGRLAPGGLLLFDANTPLTFSQFFGRTFRRGEPGLFLLWESLGPGEDGGHRADLHAFTADPEHPDRWTRSISHHVQHHHPHARMTAALEAAGLELLLTEGQRDNGPRDPFCDETVHTKRVYLARLP